MIGSRLPNCQTTTPKTTTLPEIIALIVYQSPVLLDLYQEGKKWGSNPN